MMHSENYDNNSYLFQNKNRMAEVLKEAAFSLAEAKFTAGDFSHTVIQNVSQAQFRVRTKKENVVGTFTYS